MNIKIICTWKGKFTYIVFNNVSLAEVITFWRQNICAPQDKRPEKLFAKRRSRHKLDVCKYRNRMVTNNKRRCYKVLLCDKWLSSGAKHYNAWCRSSPFLWGWNFSLRWPWRMRLLGRDTMHFGISLLPWRRAVLLPLPLYRLNLYHCARIPFNLIEWL